MDKRTFADLCKIEPQLLSFEPIPHDIDDSEFDKIYESLKTHLCPIVGWEAKNKELRNSESWDIAIKYLVYGYDF